MYLITIGQISMKCGTDIHGARQETLATLVITKLIT